MLPRDGWGMNEINAPPKDEHAGFGGNEAMSMRCERMAPTGIKKEERRRGIKDKTKNLVLKKDR